MASAIDNIFLLFVEVLHLMMPSVAKVKLYSVGGVRLNISV